MKGANGRPLQWSALAETPECKKLVQYSTPLYLPQDHTRVEKGDDKDTVRKKTVKFMHEREHC
jgi:hypothetical protein